MLLIGYAQHGRLRNAQSTHGTILFPEAQQKLHAFLNDRSGAVATQIYNLRDPHFKNPCYDIYGPLIHNEPFSQ